MPNVNGGCARWTTQRLFLMPAHVYCLSWSSYSFSGFWLLTLAEEVHWEESRAIVSFIPSSARTGHSDRRQLERCTVDVEYLISCLRHASVHVLWGGPSRLAGDVHSRSRPRL
jgi:hypothetical protein